MAIQTRAPFDIDQSSHDTEMRTLSMVAYTKWSISQVVIDTKGLIMSPHMPQK